MSLRGETRKRGFRDRMEKELGASCVCCGSIERIEYHHIVPLHLGGTNRMSNIVPLCYSCHKSAHNGRHIKDYKGGNLGGRKPKMKYENACEIFNLYADGLIGTKKCKQMLGYAKSSKLTDLASYKRYLKESGIDFVKNNIDIICANCPDGLLDGKVVGCRHYEDGHSELMYYRDTGLNNVEYTKRNGNKG